ncbi:MAG: phage tail tape measure protein [Thermoguttaceae bacterium]|jgi:hypothetical protein|nr:phage tail tape measure protein [Thermoguttaceae bacterium]
MSAAKGIRAGKAYVEIYGDNNPLSRALKQSGKMLDAWGQKMRAYGARLAAAGTAVLATLLGSARSFAKTGDEIAKMSKRIGASTEFVSALGYAAQEGGTDLSAMETGVRRLQRSAYDAANGSKAAADAFATLGVETRDANGNLKSTEELFRETATALATVQNNTAKAALAQTLFGRAGTALLPMLHDGAAGLDAAMQRAQELGLVWNGTDSHAAEELTDAMMRIQSVAGRLWTSIGGALAPALTDLTNRLAAMIAPAAEWIRQNGHIVQLTAAGAATAVAAGGALIGLGVAMTVVGKAAATLATAIGVAKVATGALFVTTLAAKVGTLAYAAATTIAKTAHIGLSATVLFTKTVLGGLAAMTSVTKMTMLALAGATTIAKTALLGIKLVALAITSPVGVLIAGLVALAANFDRVGNVAGKALQWLGAQFQWLRGHATETFQGIADAMAAGDMGLAFEVGWSAAMVVWYKYTQKITETWAEVKHRIMSVWDEVRYFLSDTFSELSGLWTGTTADMNTTWGAFVSGLKSTFTTFMEWFKTAWNWVQTKATEGFATVFAYAAGVDAELTRQAGRETIAAYQRGEWKPPSSVPRAVREERAATRDREVGAAASKLADAQKQWEEALAKAREARTAAEASAAAGPTVPAFDAWDPMDFGKRAASIQGTFSAAAAQAMGRGEGAQMLDVAKQQLEKLTSIERTFLRGVAMAD